MGVWVKQSEGKNTHGHECSYFPARPQKESVGSKLYFNSIPVSPVSLAFSPRLGAICSELHLGLIWSATNTRADTHTSSIKAEEQLARSIWMTTCLSTSFTQQTHTRTHRYLQAW